METITAKKIDMRFDECYIKDVEENYKPYVCVACDTFLTFRSKMTIAVSKLCDCHDIFSMKDWNKVEQSLHLQYIVTDLPDCIELKEQNILQKIILSPCSSYVMFQDNKKTMVIQYVGSASITYVELKFQQWPVQIITCMEYRQNI